MPKVIRYKSNSGNIREMTVINGQPYYKSTGHNSGEKDVWFPFLMVIGSQFFEIPKEFKKKRYLINAAREDGTGWIMKYQAKLLPHPKIENVCNGRLPTKECIVISIQLGSVNESFLLSHLSWKEYQKALRKEIQLEDTKQVIENPDEVNQWLIEQGAEFLKKSLTKEPIEILDTLDDRHFRCCESVIEAVDLAHRSQKQKELQDVLS